MFFYAPAPILSAAMPRIRSWLQKTEFYVRATETKDLIDLRSRVTNVFEGSAKATGTEVRSTLNQGAGTAYRGVPFVFPPQSLAKKPGGKNIR